MTRLWIGFVLFALAAALLPAGGGAFASPYDLEFRAFLDKVVTPQARKAGVSARTIERELVGLTPDTDLPGLVKPGTTAAPPKVNYQSEFREPGRYFRESQFDPLVGGGRAILKKHAATLAAIEKRYGVPGRIIVAIWARESAYGNAKIPYDAIRVLATRAFMGQRPDFFRGELVAALKMIDDGHISRAAMKSSWGGALGNPQFLPSSYLKHAVDFDGDGHEDIWNSPPDTMASIANFLKHNGWVAGRDWGYEVDLPKSVSCSREGPDRGQKIGAWIADGITRVAGRRFPDYEVNRPGFLMLPSGRLGPAFMATENFYILKTYNESDTYALFVGHLADRFGTNQGFVGTWKPVPKTTRGAVRDIQLRLEKAGYDVGGADGLIGFKTRRSIGEWQKKGGKPETCWIG